MGREAAAAGELVVDLFFEEEHGFAGEAVEDAEDPRAPEEGVETGVVGGEIFGPAEDAGAGGINFLRLGSGSVYLSAHLRRAKGGKREWVRKDEGDGCVLRKASMGRLVFGASHELLAPIFGDIRSLMESASCGELGSHCQRKS